MPTHPLPVFLNNGVPVSLSSDDPAVFGNMGLSFDFFQVRYHLASLHPHLPFDAGVSC